MYISKISREFYVFVLFLSVEPVLMKLSADVNVVWNVRCVLDV